MEILTVGVVGAGVIGVGVAQNLVCSGYQVLLLDINDLALNRAQLEIEQALRFRSFFRKPGPAKKSIGELLERISFTTDYGTFEETDFIIENVPEIWAIKQEVWKRLDSICPPLTIFAANTSAISITRLASATQRASRVLGIHFMNPVPMKRLVEVVPGQHTSAETLETAKGLLTHMGKEWVIVNDSPGFVSNRVLMLTINEAIFLVHERVAPAEDVDQIFRDCFGHKMGPLETADLIGLDTVLFSIEVLFENFADSKYRPCPLLKRMVEAGLHGCKSGQGFYRYPAKNL